MSFHRGDAHPTKSGLVGDLVSAVIARHRRHRKIIFTTEAREDGET